MQRLIGRFQEVGVANRFQQIIECVDLIAVERILAESGRKDDARVGLQDAGKLHSVELRHLDIEEKQVDRLFAEGGKRVDGAIVFSRQFQERRLVYITFQQADSQRFVVDDCTLQNHSLISFFTFRFFAAYLQLQHAVVVVTLYTV